MRFDGEKVACFVKLSRWSGCSLDCTSLTVHQAKYLFLNTLTKKVEWLLLSEKKIECIVEKFAMRSNLVLVYINLSFVNIS